MHRLVQHHPKWHQQWFNEIKELVDGYHPDLLYTDGPVPFKGRGPGAGMEGTEAGLSMIAHLYNTKASGGKTEAV